MKDGTSGQREGCWEIWPVDPEVNIWDLRGVAKLSGGFLNVSVEEWSSEGRKRRQKRLKIPTTLTQWHVLAIGVPAFLCVNICVSVSICSNWCWLTVSELQSFITTVGSLQSKCRLISVCCYLLGFCESGSQDKA